jgi:DNA-binding transcriptional LysR family regulator
MIAQVELRQLRYVVAIAHHGGFTRAATELNVAQPAVSQQIRRLETEFGIELFERTSRHVRLTQAGELLLARAQRVLTELSDAREELDQLRGLERGDVSIGAMAGLAPARLRMPAMLRRFRGRYPGVDIHLREETADAMVALLLRDELDLGFAFVGAEASSGLASVALFDEELVVIAPPGHRLAAGRSVRLDRLAGEPLVTFKPGAAVRRAIEHEFAAVGVEPRMAFETDEPTTIRALVAGDLAVSLVPRSFAEQPGPVVAIMRVRPRPLTRTLHLVWREGRRRPPAAEEFLRFARGELGA